MASLNRVQLIGRLGRDPEARYTPKGTKIVTFTVAVDHHWRNAENPSTKPIGLILRPGEN